MQEYLFIAICLLHTINFIFNPDSTNCCLGDKLLLNAKTFRWIVSHGKVDFFVLLIYGLNIMQHWMVIVWLSITSISSRNIPKVWWFISQHHWICFNTITIAYQWQIQPHNNRYLSPCWKKCFEMNCSCDRHYWNCEPSDLYLYTSCILHDVEMFTAFLVSHLFCEYKYFLWHLDIFLCACVFQ